MRSSFGFVLAVLAAISVCISAAPYEQRWRWPRTPSLSQTKRWPFSNAGKRDCPGDMPPPPPTMTHPKKSYLDLEARALTTGSCDLQNAVKSMDLTAVSPALPSPAGLTLFQVAIGRGTQNYTCDLANATATPVAIGALATLYNFSCVAAQQPALLKRLPHIALNLPIPTINNTNANIINDLESGHHYFIDDFTVPFFNLDTSNHQYGMGAMAKANASDAPSDAISGPQGAKQSSFGAVQWLRLTQDSSVGGDWKEVYRLNTAGGDPPKMCTGQQAAFEIPYAAEYWLFT